MQGIEEHRLTPREKRIVLTVVILTLLGLAVWIGMLISWMPDPSHGTFVAPPA